MKNKKINKKLGKWLFLLLIPVLILVFLVLNKEPKVEYSTVLAQEGFLQQTVSESGTIKPVKELALNFLSSGRLETIAVAVGDKIEVGQELATLENVTLLTREKEAEASLNVAQATLSKLLAGASNSTINISLTNLNLAQTAVSSAKVELDKTKKTVAENMRQVEKALADLESEAATDITPAEQAIFLAQTAYENTKKNGQKNIDNARSSALITFSDKIITAKISMDNLNTLLVDDDTKNVLGAKNSIILEQTKTARQLALSLTLPAEESVELASKQETANMALRAGEKTKDLLTQARRALDYSYSLLEASVVSSKFTQAKLDAYKNNASAQIAQINGAITAVEASIQTLNNAVLNYETNLLSASDNLQQAQVNLENARLSARNALNAAQVSGDQQIAAAQTRLDNANKNLAVSQAQYDNTVAPARTQDVVVAEAQVKQAEANLEGIRQQIKDSVLIAPVSGVVNQVNYEVGEQFGLGAKPLISLLVDNSFNIEVDISESSISKVKLGDEVEITIDAFPDDLILLGEVSFIEPAQTVIQDVVYYKVKIDFKDLDKTRLELTTLNLSIKSGMTANVVIVTEKLEKVIQVPARTVLDGEGGKIVRILQNGQLVERVVKIGLAGDEGMVEIKEGLAVGEEVITFIKNGAK